MTPTTTSESTASSTDSFTTKLADTSRRLQDSAAGMYEERVKPSVEAVTSYAKEEPVKTMLIAAACGAALMGLVALTTRSSSRASVTPRSARRMAQSAADTATQMAHDAIDRASDKADAALKSTRGAAQSARESASSAFDNLSDTMKGWREQAQPFVDRIQPQLESLTAYAKSEPAKSAMIVAAAGALIAGLVTMATSSDD